MTNSVEGVELRGLSRTIRRTILEQAHRAHVGHIGSALSIADLVAALYGGPFRELVSSHHDRDRFILSKGHASLAVYAALHANGVIDRPTLDTYCGDGSRLGVHPEHGVPGIDFSTGSLGHGLAIAAGAALAARWQHSSRRVFVLLSDAECDEGSTWEAAMFAAHHRLGKLTVVIDANGQQATGYTSDVLDLEPLSERWRATGWRVLEVDGHDMAALQSSFEVDGGLVDPPRVIVARTTFGKGVSFMERQILWHYMPMSEAQYLVAVAEIEAGI